MLDLFLRCIGMGLFASLFFAAGALWASMKAAQKQAPRFPLGVKLPKDPVERFEEGDVVYWDPGKGLCTKHVSISDDLEDEEELKR